MVRILTWNLFHGRAVPDVPRPLGGAFAAMLAGWEWDVALLQEVPPWWPERLAAACGARAFTAKTSRNQLPAVSRALAARRPDVIRSWGGGANAILVRGDVPVTAHHRLRLALAPERRVLHAVCAGGIWFGNLHATAHDEARAQADLRRAAGALRRWAGDGAAVIGGDTNTRTPAFPGFEPCGGHVLDWVFARGLRCAGPVTVPPRHDARLGVNLSDHRPVLAAVDSQPRGAGGPA
jgi:endonuclease/exonuclease/phosphatase family metal-dependent hydrolase